jgi:hypothetical protein
MGINQPQPRMRLHQILLHSRFNRKPTASLEGGASVSMQVSLKVFEGGQVVVFVSGKMGKKRGIWGALCANAG